MTEENAGTFVNSAKLEKISNLENIKEKEDAMENNELYEIRGGASATTLNAIARVINTLVSIGQMIGSAIKRKLQGKTNAC